MLYLTAARIAFLTIIAHLAFTDIGLSEDSSSCSALGQLAETMMKLRQRDWPLSEILEPLELEATTPASLEVMRKMLSDAYMRPIESSEEKKAEAVSAFRLAIEQQCHGIS